MLAIVLSIAIMIVVFSIILVQGTVFTKKVLGQESQLCGILLNNFSMMLLLFDNLDKTLCK
jgi:hypothetical protein